MLNGYRNGIMVMRRIAELLEKNPQAEVPTVMFKTERSVDEEGDITYPLVCKVLFEISEHANYSIYDADERKEDVRARSEVRFQDLIEALGPDAEWTANDPSAADYTSKEYFILSADVDGCVIKLKCSRSDVGETISVADSGPEVTEVDGAIRVIRQTATMWRPNITLTRAAPIQYQQIDPSVRQLTA